MNDETMLRAQDRKINWYPGHMARAKRLLAEQLSRVDAVVELCDARIPRASRNPDLGRLVADKRRLLVLGKADLAEEAQTRAWLAFYRAQGIEAMSFDSVRGRAKDVVARVERLTQDMVERMAQRGVRKTVRVMIVGVPNVGKSTFTNRINGTAIARTGDRPGVTRSNQWVRITPYLELLDTPGLLWPNLEDQRDAQALAFVGTIGEQARDQQLLAIRLLEWLSRASASARRVRSRLPGLRCWRPSAAGAAGCCPAVCATRTGARRWCSTSSARASSGASRCSARPPQEATHEKGLGGAAGGDLPHGQGDMGERTRVRGHRRGRARPAVRPRGRRLRGDAAGAAAAPCGRQQEAD